MNATIVWSADQPAHRLAKALEAAQAVGYHYRRLAITLWRTR